MDKNSSLQWNFQTFEWLGENSLNSSCHIWSHKSVFLYCINLLCHGRLFFCTFLATTSMEELCLMIPKSGAKFEEKHIFCFRLTKSWWILIRALENLKKCTWIPPYYATHTTSELRKYRQNLKKNWHVVWKMTWGICQIFIRTVQNVKISIILFKVENAWVKKLHRSYK